MQTEISSRKSGPTRPRVVALSGGVGGAKLVRGLDGVVRAGNGQLTVAVNTGDDFEHLGLHICPDLDSVVYALAGINDPLRGWGRANESWNFMRALEALGGAGWFSLGDRDLALHIERSQRLRRGDSLSKVTAYLADQFNLDATVLPATDDMVRTMVHTDAGILPFQQYFVREACKPAVKSISFAGADKARANPALLSALADPRLDAIVLCPSNPYLSIDPILAIPGVRKALEHASAPVIAVSPVINGDALKGPTAKIMRELGNDVSPAAIVSHYGDMIDAIVVDSLDAAGAFQIDLPVLATNITMHCTEDKEALARNVLHFASTLVASRGGALQERLP
ncbi:2-phospho-L-lactate transferase [compost metagenome]